MHMLCLLYMSLYDIIVILYIIIYMLYMIKVIVHA